jgi:uncharacterized protein
VENVDYFGLINKYISPGSAVYNFYVPHVTLVTAKALKAARKLGLPPGRLRFIEEAAMLHDIGIVKVDEAALGCYGDLPYICHGVLGRYLLEREGLPQHSLVAERHIGVGLTRAEIFAKELPIPPRDMLPETLEEKIISWADLFFSKRPERLWTKKTAPEVERHLIQFGQRHRQIFREWTDLFG